METIEGGNADAPTNNDVEAAVINDGNNEPTAADPVNTIADDDNNIVQEVSPPESLQKSCVTEGEGGPDATAHENNVEAAQNINDIETSSAGSQDNEEAAKEFVETDVAATSNDVDLLGFTDEGTAGVITNQVEISTFPESNTIAESVSNDFDLLGFGGGEQPQKEELPIANDFPAADANDDEGIVFGTDDGEKNVEAQMEAEEAMETDHVPTQSDTANNELLHIPIANEDDKRTASETIVQTETAETISFPNESGGVEDLLSLTQNEPSTTVVTFPESTADGVDIVEATQLSSEEVSSINDDSSEAKDTASKNDESLPPVLSGSGGSENAITEEPETSIGDINDSNVVDGDNSQANFETNVHTGDEMSPPSITEEPSATIVALPEISAMNEDTSQTVDDSNNNEVIPTVTVRADGVYDANNQENITQGEGGIEEVHNVEAKDELDMSPVQEEEIENPVISAATETHTEEEAEWLSMGLSLGDALRQIVTLTDERDSALAICQEKDDIATQAESLLVEVQSRLEAEMNRRAESDSKARKLLETMKAYEARLESFEKMEDELEAAQASLVSTVSEKSKLELEIAKLREVKDESERKEAVLSSRLNEAKKKEANKSNTAGRLELDNEELRANLESTKAELETVSKAKTKLEGTMEKLKTKAVERVKQAETALKEERELNEERKKKMKLFVETKAEELREAKESASDMNKELQETRASLTACREREESIQKELESARLKYREVQRDMERMKRNAEALHNMGNNLEEELQKSANETEEHKKKRISAKHELMTMMRTLEVEKGVSEKLRESMKFTFAPKAQSQQQLLSECLRDLEQELDRLSIRLGKPLLPQPQTDDSEPSKTEIGMERSPSNGSGKKARRGRASKADMDTERLISNLEQETQHVSKGIMALVSSIERMRVLLDEDNPFNCMAFFSNHLGLALGTREARHQRLGGENPTEDGEETMSITSFEQK